MTAVITEVMKPWLIARCPDCDDLYIDSAPARNRATVQRHVDEHDRYAHSEPPVPHHVVHTDQRWSGGYSVECCCHWRGEWPTTNFTEWVCPLDKTVDRTSV